MSVKYIWHVYGLLLCYLVLYIVAVVTQLSLINIAYVTRLNSRICVDPSSGI